LSIVGEENIEIYSNVPTNSYFNSFKANNTQPIQQFTNNNEESKNIKNAINLNENIT